MAPEIKPLRPRIIDSADRPELTEDTITLAERANELADSIGKSPIECAYLSFGQESMAFLVTESGNEELVATAVGAVGEVPPHELLKSVR
tara:strand:+ start:339 stop:608 length:270 start_codon:yes stop_codon:yes gene_type:complete